METKNEYATKDMHFAAFLQVKGMFIKELEQRGKGPGGHNVIYFIFEDKKRCEELDTIFWNGVGDDVMVNVKKYFTVIRDLRSRVFSINRIIDEKEKSLKD